MSGGHQAPAAVAVRPRSMRSAIFWRTLALLLLAAGLQWAIFWGPGAGASQDAGLDSGSFGAALCVAFAACFWGVLVHALFPLKALGESLRDRSPGDVRPVSEKQPAELAPLALAINDLMHRQEVSMDQQKRFLADASHQLRTPFAVLRTQLQGLMSGELEGRATMLKMLGTIDRSSELVQQLLCLTKVEQLTRQADWVDVELSAVAKDVAMELAPLLARKKLDFTFQAVEVPLRTDPWMLGELVRNLMSNAIHHTPEGAAMGLAIRMLPDGPELLVWDNGGGMDQAVQARIFQAFHSASGPGGIGLGLSICRQIAVGMDASVSLFNRCHDERIVGVDAVVRWPSDLAVGGTRP